MQRKRLTEAQRKETLANAVQHEVQHELKMFKETVCMPRTKVTEKLESDITLLRTDVQDIKELISSVSANGNKGLESSLRDLYSKSSETHNTVKELQTSLGELKVTVDGLITTEKSRFVNKSLRQIFTEKNTFTKILWYVVIYILATVILHAFGVDASRILTLIKGANS